MLGDFANISLLSGEFWTCAILGIILMRLANTYEVRRWCFFVINLLFLSYLLTPLPLVAIGFVFLVVNLSRDRLFAALALVLVILFIAHKRADLLLWLHDDVRFIPYSLHIERLNPVLALMGFSYLFLRCIELARVSFDRRHELPDIVDSFNYLMPFHMVAMGPIQSYGEYHESYKKIPDSLNTDNALLAVERIVRGLFKKFVLVYFIDELFLTGFQSEGWYFWFELQVFAIWIYLDFSAYMDVVVGIGRLMGVNTPENFNRPYLSRNITIFWERWHITLGTFIKRNVFLPLQLYFARKLGRQYALLSASIAFLVSFALCGLWHGLTYNFLLWGLFHACGLIVCNAYKFLLKKYLNKKEFDRYNASVAIRVVSTIVTFEFIAISFLVAFPPVIFD